MTKTMTKSKTKMFTVNGKTVKRRSTITGCDHLCVYCWFVKLATGRLKNTPKYKDCGIKPKFHKKEHKKSYGKNHVWFIGHMGDMWCKSVPSKWIIKILEKCQEADKSNTFYFLTKNPKRYSEFHDYYQDNFILGCTIESDIHYPDVSKASYTHKRFIDFYNVKYPRRFISIEPIMNFVLDNFLTMIYMIKPEFVYIGYDNHKNNLIEPSLNQTKRLIKAMESFTEVRIKTLRKGNQEGGR